MKLGNIQYSTNNIEIVYRDYWKNVFMKKNKTHIMKELANTQLRIQIIMKYPRNYPSWGIF